MTQLRKGSFCRPLQLAAVAFALVVASACSRPLLTRAIAARGGSLASLSRVSTAEVEQAFPGRWAWRFDYRVPDQLRWTLETYGEEQSISFDGTSVRFYLGSTPLPAPPATLVAFQSLVRWTAVTTLDALAGNDEVALRELPPDALPPGAAAGLEVIYRADGTRYVLSFDADDLLIAADGPIVVPTIAAGRMRASYGDFDESAGLKLPRVAHHTLDDQPFFRERIERWIPNDPRLTEASFAGPPLRDSR